MNKGILCGTCNHKFSLLDDLLARQLSFINGMVGVRPDRSDEPKPAQVDSTDGPLTIDHSGKPSLAAPREVASEQLPNGRRRASIQFGSEKQIQDWCAKQRAAGLRVKQERRVNRQHYLNGPIQVEWSFGGNDALREVGRIALNFLAYWLPDIARVTELQSFKDYVEGKHTLQEGDPRFVWYAPVGAFAIPESPFAFGHQVLLVSDTATTSIFARVRFFSTFDLFVWFGRLPGVLSEAVIFDIDPLADHPPDDLIETVLEIRQFPSAVTPPTTDTRDLEELQQMRFRSLLVRVEDRQWAASTQGLLDSLNAARTMPLFKRVNRVAELLEPHRGRVLFLAQYVAEEIRRSAHDDGTRFLADAMEHLLTPDPKSLDGLSTIARVSLQIAFVSLSDVVAKELETGPLTNERLRLLLAGDPGAHAVGSVLIQPIIDALGGAR
jgi:hypothetical protein